MVNWTYSLRPRLKPRAEIERKGQNIQYIADFNLITLDQSSNGVVKIRLYKKEVEEGLSTERVDPPPAGSLHFSFPESVQPVRSNCTHSFTSYIVKVWPLNRFSFNC